MTTRLDALREQHGGVHPGAAKKVKDHLDAYQTGFIRNAPFLVMATADADGHCDASPKGGTPGFVQVLDERTLLLPDIGGNRLFQGYDNIAGNPHVGLVFMIPGQDVTVRVNGHVEVLEADAVRALGAGVDTAWADDNTVLVQGLRIHIDEAYFHCPRAFQFGAVWDPEQIAANAGTSLKDLAAT